MITMEDLENLRWDLIRLGLTPEENSRLTEKYNTWVRTYVSNRTRT